MLQAAIAPVETLDRALKGAPTVRWLLWERRQSRSFPRSEARDRDSRRSHYSRIEMCPGASPAAGHSLDLRHRLPKSCAMPRYVALLRGVNPMNAKMPELKRAFESAG